MSNNAEILIGPPGSFDSVPSRLRPHGTPLRMTRAFPVSMILARFFLFFLSAALTTYAADKAPIAIAEVQRAEPVNFDREVFPFLSDNCLACHCQTTHKGGLNLETPELMLKGGENGPAIVPSHARDSLALQAAAHLDADLAMPPRDNKAKARDLTPEQLGLFKLWIDQGAKVSPKTERPIAWQPLAENLGGIFAVAVTADGQFAACARANRVFVYHLPSGQAVANEVAGRDQVNALAFNPDGTLMASGGFREVKLWRRARDVQKLQLTAAGSRAAVSPDGKWLATASDDGSVKIWTLPAGQPARSIAAASGAVVALRFSPDSVRLACGGADKSLTLWNVADGQPLGRVETPGDIAALAWLGESVATGGSDGVVRIWSAALAPVKELKGGPVTALEAAAPNRIFTGSTDGLLRIWEIEKEQPVTQMNHSAPITAIAMRPDGQRFASAGADHAAKLWAADGKLVAELRGNRYAQEAAAERERILQVGTGTVAYRKEGAQNSEKQLTAARERVKKSTDAIAPKQQELDAKQKAVAEAAAAKTAVEQALASAEAELKKGGEAMDAADKAVLLAKNDAEALKSISTTDPAAIDKALAEAAAKTQEAAKAKADRDQREAARKQAADKIEPEAKKLADAEAALKKAETARTVVETELTLAKTEEQKTTAALTEAQTASAAAEAARKAADDELQAARQAATAAEMPMQTIAFSPDNQTLATAGDDQLIHTWSATSGAPVEVFKGHAAVISALTFTPGGDLVSAARDGAAVVWNLTPEWKLERTIGTGEANSPLTDRVNALAFSRDGKLLATGSGEPSRGGAISLWDAATGALVRDLPKIHSDAVLGLDFSPDGKLLASGAADKMARVTDLASGKVARTFEGHTHHVLAVSWSLDGRTLATAGADNLVKVWDAVSGEKKKNIEGYEKEVTAVRFAGASGTLLTSSGDNRVRLVGLDGKEVRAFPEVADFMQAAAITADGQVVLAGGQDGVLRVWNAADGKPLLAFPR